MTMARSASSLEEANSLFSRSVGRLVGRSVGRLVGRLVGRSPFYFFGVFKRFELTAPAQMPQ